MFFVDAPNLCFLIERDCGYIRRGQGDLQTFHTLGQQHLASFGPQEGVVLGLGKDPQDLFAELIADDDATL